MNQRWTNEEEIRFVKGVASGKNMDELSNIHNRSKTALELRIKKIIYDNVANGTKPSTLSRKLNLPKEKIMQYYFAYKDFREKTGKEVKEVVLSSSDRSIDTPQSGGSRSYHSDRQSDRKVKKVKKIKPNNKHRGGSNMDHKIEMISKQNELLKAIIKNNEMKTYIRHLYKNDKLDKKTRKLVRKMHEYGLI